MQGIGGQWREGGGGGGGLIRFSTTRAPTWSFPSKYRDDKQGHKKNSSRELEASWTPRSFHGDRLPTIAVNPQAMYHRS